MRQRRIAGTALWVTGLMLVLAAGCKKEEDPRVPPAMSFKTGAGYTSADDTVGMEDTLLIGVIIDKTEDPLTSLNISRAYDGGGSTTLENVPISTDHFEYDREVITRAQAGSERYTFSVIDRDGNITTRSLLLTVQ